MKAMKHKALKAIPNNVVAKTSKFFDICAVLVNVKSNTVNDALLLWEQCILAYSASSDTRMGAGNNDVKVLSAIKHVSAKDGVLSLEAPSEYAKNWFIWHFHKVFLEIAKSIAPEIKEISVSAPKVKEKTLRAPELSPPEKLKIGNFSKKYTLDNFIAGTSNELAMKSARFIASKQRNQDNLLVIKGASGLGKTHLLHAIGNEASASWARRAVLCDADRFFKEKRKGSLFVFYQADILLFDDLQALYSSESAQKDLLEIFDVLKKKNSSIVVSIGSKGKGQAFAGLSEFLKGSIKCELKCSDLQTRIAILRQKAAEKGLPVEPLEDCWPLIAAKLGESVSSLEGAVNDLAARQALLKCEITSSMARSFYEEPKAKSKTASIEAIAGAAAKAYAIPQDAMRGKSRLARVNRPRQIAIHLCRQMGFSLTEIGKFFNRDASSILNAIKNINKEIASEKGYSLEFELKDIMNTLS